MFEAIFLVISLAILAVEIIEVRQKCREFPGDACEDIPFLPGNWRTEND